MAKEDTKDFNAMLNDSKDMPKYQTITDKKSIEKYGGNRMYFAPPIDYDKIMRRVPHGKLLTLGAIRDYFAKISGADLQSRSLRECLSLLPHGQAISALPINSLLENVESQRRVKCKVSGRY